MKRFLNFIKESKGISQINKIYTDYFIEYYKQLGYGEFTIEDSDDQRLPLTNCLLIINKENPHALFDPTQSFIKKENDNYYLYNIIFIISINDKDDIWLLKELISHEINHCVEYYKILKWNEENKIDSKIVHEIKPRHLAFKKIINEIKVETNNPFSFFKHLVYLSLDSEYNARVSQLFQFLKSIDSKDKKVLEEKLKTSKSYNAYLQLENFNSKDFINECINKIGLDGIIKITKDLNKQLLINNFNRLTSYNFINDDVINYEDLINYYNKWEKMFKYKNKNHIKNLYRMIDEVINDNGLREGYKFEEK